MNVSPTDAPAAHAHPKAATLGQLKETDYRFRPIKQELRDNLIHRLRTGEDLFPGVRGYRHTVVPQVCHAILSRHDMLFLGLRGQAKTRMLRMLPELLDEWVPVVAELDIPDDPVHPTTTQAKRLISEHGDDTPIRWMHRSERYHEKLATPDVTIADLIGEIDIVKHAEGRYLSDESTMHFGLIPRTNRGIFAVNELPDLSPRIQVGLFNVLEERDIQIRGYPIRLMLAVCLVFSANPADNTTRGRIVTPLTDRIGSVIRTHYPETTRDAMQITNENAWTNRTDQLNQGTLTTVSVDVPPFMHRIIEEAVAAARTSSHINQASGVSVRTSIACLENMVSSAERRALMTGEDRVVPRVCDLAHMVSATRGKIELLLADDGDNSEDRLVHSLLGEAVRTVFDEVSDPDEYEGIIDQFETGLKLVVGDEVSAQEAVDSFALIEGMPEAIKQLAQRLEVDPDDVGMQACLGEFLLEALYVHNRLSKASGQDGTRYTR